MSALRLSFLGMVPLACVGVVWYLAVELARDRRIAASSSSGEGAPAAFVREGDTRSGWKIDLARRFPFGTAQALAMIADRPQMSLYGDTVAPMVIWAAAKFEGDDTGYPIEWDPTPPEDRTALSEMEWPYVASSAAIRIRPAPAHRDAEDSVSLFDGLWSCAVFELLNHANASKYRAVHENCYSYTREEWVRAYARVEFQTVLAMRRFFRNVWEPWSVEHGHAPVRGHWYADAPDGFEDWLAQFDDPDDYPWRAYGSYYDEHIATANRGD